MKHDVVERGADVGKPRASRRPLWQRGFRRRRMQTAHSAEAMRFAEVCAAIGATTMLHDLMPDVVTVTFGEKTQMIADRLHARGWTFVGTGDWKGERVLGVSFAGDGRVNITAQQLADALIGVVGELEIAEARAW